jgi:hypothetical protein
MYLKLYFTIQIIRTVPPPQSAAATNNAIAIPPQPRLRSPPRTMRKSKIGTIQ